MEMSRRNTSVGAQPDSYQLRWHSVANPGTPRGDLMSSPDPLNDGASPDHPPSSNTRRVTRSQRAHKFLSLGASPSKQAYELNKGTSGGSSKRPTRGGLVVSVEETDEDGTADEATRQSLFPTPRSGASRERATTTTTTVPLKYSIEDESSDVLGSTNATPQPRKTRIRASNGTPAPKLAGGKRRREPSPPPRTTPRQPDTRPDSSESDSMADDLTQRSPTPKRRARSPRTRAAEPSSELGTGPARGGSPAKRSVRRRRQPVLSGRLAGRTDPADDAAATIQVPLSEDDLQRDITTTATTDGERGMPTPPAQAEPESDLWLAAVSRETTPRASVQPVETLEAQIEEREEERQEERQEELQEEREASVPEDDYGYIAPAASDVSSAENEPLVEPTMTMRNDTIAQGEDFSMILMNSIPSLQASTQGVAPPPSQYSDIGDDTNLIINNTLEYLRQGEVADREDEGEDDADDDADTLSGRDSGNEPAREESATPQPVVADLQSGSELEAQPEVSQPVAVNSDKPDELVSPASRESENEPAEEEAAAPEPLIANVPSDSDLEGQSDKLRPEVVEPAVEHESEPAPDAPAYERYMLETIVEEEFSQLERQVEKEVSADVEAAATQMVAVEPEPEPEVTSFRQPSVRPSPAMSRNTRLLPSPRKPANSSPLRYRVAKRYVGEGSRSPRKSPRAAGSPDRTVRPASSDSAEAQENMEDSMMYEDSFSEIPEEVLARFAPRNGREMSWEELNDEQMDEIMDELVASQEQNAAATEIAEDAEMAHEPETANFEHVQEAGQAAQTDSEVPDVDAGEEQQAERGDDAVMSDEGEENSNGEQAAEAVVEVVAEELPFPSTASEAQPEATRLPTPDSSPQNAPIQETLVSAHQQPRMHSFFGSPVEASHLAGPSSTPWSQRYWAAQQAGSAAQVSGSSLEETPRQQIPSPTQQPQSVAQESAPAGHVRPALSPIVRIGRALQSVTSDPPSPEARERQLGSPFRSSGSREPRSGSKEQEASGRPSKSPSTRASKSPALRVLTFESIGESSRSNEHPSPPRESTKSVKPSVVASKAPQLSPRREPSLVMHSPTTWSRIARGIKKPTTEELLPPLRVPQPTEASPSVPASASPLPESLPSRRGLDLAVAFVDSLPPVVPSQRQSPPRERIHSVESLPSASPSLDAALQAKESTVDRVSGTNSLLDSPPRRSTRGLELAVAFVDSLPPVVPSQRQSPPRERTHSVEPLPSASPSLDVAPQAKESIVDRVSRTNSLPDSPPRRSTKSLDIAVAMVESLRSARPPQRQPPPEQTDNLDGRRRGTKGLDLAVAFVDSLQPAVPPQRQSPPRERAHSVEPLPSADPSLDVAPQAEEMTVDRVSGTNSLPPSPSSDVNLSWIINEGSISPDLRGDNTLQDVVMNAISSRPAATNFTARSSVLPASVSSEPALEQAQLESEGEWQPSARPDEEVMSEPELPPLPPPRANDTDMWEAEAQRESPRRRKHSSSGGKVRKRNRVAKETFPPLREASTSWMRNGEAPAANTPRVGPAQPAIGEPGSPRRRDGSSRRDTASRRVRRARELGYLRSEAQWKKPARQKEPARQEEPARLEEPSRLEEDAEEYSLLGRKRAAEEAQNLTESAAKASRFDLSTFFSSPIAIPGMLRDRFFPGKTKRAEAAPIPTPALIPAPAPPVVPAGRLFPQSPATQNAPVSDSSLNVGEQEPTPATQRSESSATSTGTPATWWDQTLGRGSFGKSSRANILARNSRSKPLPQSSGPNIIGRNLRPTLTSQARPTLFGKIGKANPNTSVAQPVLPSTSTPRPWSLRRFATPLGEATKSRNAEEATTQKNPPIAQSRISEERHVPAVVPPKLNPAPWSKGASQAAAGPFTAAKGSLASSGLFTEPRGPRSGMSDDDIVKWQRYPRWGCNSVDSNASDDVIMPFMKPLPPKDAQPTKSNLRNPLKPHTPGRVVEFTSSVMSPHEQELARYKRRVVQGMLPELLFDDCSMDRQPPLLTGQVNEGSGNDQRSQGSSDVCMTDAPPLEESEPGAAFSQVVLSQTAWSDQHWLLLQAIVRTRRKGEFPDLGKSRADKYIGMFVNSKGESMKLERWHVDCVDAFSVYVGGWDEEELVKRLASVILGEDKRKRIASREGKRHQL